MKNFEQLTQLTELNAEEAMDINGGSLVDVQLGVNSPQLLVVYEALLKTLGEATGSKLVNELGNPLAVLLNGLAPAIKISL